MRAEPPPLHHVMWRFAAATLIPALAIVLGALLGGVWAFLGLLTMTGFLAIADRVGRRLWPGGLPAASSDRWTEALLLGLGLFHFPLLIFALWALSGHAGLSVAGWLCSLISFGLWFGQISNPVAHELIHRTQRGPFLLGMAVYISLLYGHHTSAHRLVHHRFAATDDDPNSAARGESFYAFLARAWPGEFVAGYEMEENLRGAGAPRWRNPYVIYLGGALAFALFALLAFGIDGLLVWLLLSAHAQVQLLLSDYVQHFGLRRGTDAEGAFLPFGPEHSWDAPDPISGLMMLHAPRHADHHLRPARPYPALGLHPEVTPTLPWSLPVMATIALVPPLWHRIMDRRLDRLRQGA